jgi:adenylyl-sulfate kinase
MSTTIWLTGLSGAGKTTLANALHEALATKGIAAHRIDGDILRTGLCSDLGFDKSSRTENIRRAAHVCHILNSAGIVVIAALISPYRSDREMARQIIDHEAYREVWVSTPLEVCEQRDPKGLYQKARRGELTNFTGVSDGYEIPDSPRLVLNTHDLSVAQCVQLLLDLPEIKEILE